jgi:hypothetical protein
VRKCGIRHRLDALELVILPPYRAVHPVDPPGEL